MAFTALDVVEYIAETSQAVRVIIATLIVSTLYSWTRSFLRAKKYSDQHACSAVYRNTVFDGEGRVLDKGDLLFSIRNSDAPARRSE